LNTSGGQGNFARQIFQQMLTPFREVLVVII
jgi:hypothetical protein